MLSHTLETKLSPNVTDIQPGNQDHDL